jgi:hypothetical protein
MRYKLPKRITKILISLPESGMGYQQVDFHLTTGKIIKNVTVLNCEELDFDEGFDTTLIEKATIHV